MAILGECRHRQTFTIAETILLTCEVLTRRSLEAGSAFALSGIAIAYAHITAFDIGVCNIVGGGE